MSPSAKSGDLVAAAPHGFSLSPVAHALQRPAPRLLPLLWAASSRLRNSVLLFAASLAGVLTMVLGHPWIGLAIVACGLGGYGALVVHDLFDPDLIRRVHRLRAAAAAMLPPIEARLQHPLALDLPLHAVATDELRELFRQILVAHEAVRLGLLATEAHTRESLQDTYQRCTDLSRMAEPLIVRGEKLNRYLSAHNQSGLEAEVDSLRSEALLARDVKAREMFTSAASAKVDHLATYLDVEDLYCRIKAELYIIKVSLEAVYGRIVKLHCAEEEVGGDPNELLTELRAALSSDLGSFEDGVDELSDSW